MNLVLNVLHRKSQKNFLARYYSLFISCSKTIWKEKYHSHKIIWYVKTFWKNSLSKLTYQCLQGTFHVTSETLQLISITYPGKPVNKFRFLILFRNHKTIIDVYNYLMFHRDFFKEYIQCGHTVYCELLELWWKFNSNMLFLWLLYSREVLR